MIETSLLKRTKKHALSYLESLDDRPVCATATVAELRAALARPLSESGVEPEQVIDELVHDVAGGLLATPSGRFFGWVIGGTLPAALAADWLASAWDQNAAIYACSPAAAVVEEICGEWLKELLGIPRAASFALVTGCQMAHTTALAAARHQLFANRNWDVEHRGLIGAPPIRVLTTENRHETLVRAVRLLGLGDAAIEHVGCSDDGRMRMTDLERMLQHSPDTATIVCLQAGDLHTGLYDPFTEACRIAHGHNAWVHIDGAFGLWAATTCLPALNSPTPGRRTATNG